MNSARPRITGTEMEWPVLVKETADTPYHQPGSTLIRQMIESRAHGLIMAGDHRLMSNGSRFYPDVGDHPEYATPEDTSFMGTVANEIAGENIVYDALQNMKDNEQIHDFILNKRVDDDELHTWGYHMSLSADARKIDITPDHLMPLGLHLATMNVFTGAGAIIPSPTGHHYVLAQKVLNLNTDFAGSSHTLAQPLISMRNEALAHKWLYKRVHVTSMDANMSPWATWMKLGTTSIVLRMMEEGYLKHFINFEDGLHRTAIAVAHDTGLRKPLRLENGASVTALDVQGELVQHAKKFAEHNEIAEEEQRVLVEWERAIEDLIKDPDTLVDRVDWIAKRAVLRGYMARHALSFADAIVREKDRQWSYIGPLGIAAKLREGSWKQWTPHERIDEAYYTPPTTTRAFARGALIRKYGLSPDVIFASTWDRAHVISMRRERTYDLGDPYVSALEDVPTRTIKRPGPE